MSGAGIVDVWGMVVASAALGTSLATSAHSGLLVGFRGHKSGWQVSLIGYSDTGRTFAL